MDDSTILIILGGAILLMAVVIASGARHNINVQPLKPVYKQLSDGSLQMEFFDFTVFETNRDRRLLRQYPAGTVVEYKGKRYSVAQCKKLQDDRPQKNYKYVIYLEESA